MFARAKLPPSSLTLPSPNRPMSPNQLRRNSIGRDFGLQPQMGIQPTLKGELPNLNATGRLRVGAARHVMHACSQEA